MERVEYRATGNKIGLSIKYPNDINRKWSESDTSLQCDSCSSTDISTDISGEMLVLCCHNCPTFWYGQKNTVLTWYETEEAYVSTWKLPFEPT